MLNKALKQGLGLACVMAVLAGCSSTGNKEGESAEVTQGQGSEATQVSTPVEATPVVEEAVKLATIFYFDFDQSTLNAKSRQLLTAHAEQLKAAPRSIRLEGHADERGTREYNMALGERRAKAVRDFLVLQGVNASNIEVVSYGEERPVRKASNERSWAKNRRVELK